MGKRQVFTVSAASVSWIDPRSGLPEVDAGPPAPTLTFDEITRAKICRFSHLLVCSVVVEGGKVPERRVASESGLYMRPSFLWTPPTDYPVRRDFTSGSSTHAVFVQTVGCRTKAPELVGSAVGGALAFPLTRLGARLGREVAEYASAFPPIWTKIMADVRADGSWSGGAPQRSLFPSMTYYETAVISSTSAVSPRSLIWLQRGTHYDGVPFLEAWKLTGWGRGNPWRVQDPARVSNDSIR